MTIRRKLITLWTPTLNRRKAMRFQRRRGAAWTANVTGAGFRPFLSAGFRARLALLLAQHQPAKFHSPAAMRPRQGFSLIAVARTHLDNMRGGLTEQASQRVRQHQGGSRPVDSRCLRG
jgi:hypothetical protein